MDKWLKIIKAIAKKMFLAEALPNFCTREIYKNFKGNMLGERTFYFGNKKLMANSLLMEAAPGTAETVIQLLQKEPAGAKILDYGCGQHQSQYLKQMGFAVHSADVIDFKISDFTRIYAKDGKLPFIDRQFDITVASELLEHLESPWEILKELTRVTKKSLIITTPNTVSKKSRKDFYRKGYLYWFAPKDFSYHISPIFYWQVELFCKSRGLFLSQILGNHQVFELNDHGRLFDYAESLIFKIDLPK
jgi:hypothetical protein